MENIFKNHTQDPHKKYKYDLRDLIKSQMLMITKNVEFSFHLSNDCRYISISLMTFFIRITKGFDYKYGDRTRGSCNFLNTLYTPDIRK
jgi:hypothetical protein